MAQQLRRQAHEARRESAAVCTLQRYARGGAARRCVLQLKGRQARQERAAVRLQAVLRGAAGRREAAARSELNMPGRATTAAPPAVWRVLSGCSFACGGLGCVSLAALLLPLAAALIFAAGPTLPPAHGTATDMRGARPPQARHPTLPPSELAGQFCGAWVQTSASGLEVYLRRLGVGWARRQLAHSFAPEPTWGLVGGLLQVREL